MRGSEAPGRERQRLQRQLANLRPTIRPGEVLNPKGRNQWSQRVEFEVIVRTLNEAPPEAGQPIRSKGRSLNCAIDGDKRLVLELFRCLAR